MLQYYIKLQKISILLVLLFVGITAHSQTTPRVQPVWWFGESAGANFNYFRGTTQVLNSSVTTPTAFHKGNGVGTYASLITEYRPGKVWGGMLNIAYDNRGGKFDEVQAPCNCPADLSTNLSYITVEPSLRIAPFANAFYIFAGPTISYNVSKRFIYTQDKQAEKRGDWSDIKKTSFSAQAGAGVDIPLSPASSTTQLTLSPFVSFLTDLGHKPRSSETWDLYTIRGGIALKFGTGKKKTPPPPPVVVLDRDGDGVLDVDDRCPDVPGLAALKGCPDRDGDGIADIDDKCPDVPGIAKYQGCPIPDTDGDGINDEMDKCPTVKGLARYQGCPIPDTDGDGVNDEEDKCPTRPGPASNRGCPVIAKEVVEKVNFAAKNVFFSTGSYKLLPKSFKSLDAVVELMKADNSLMIDIDGHTDSQGTDESNQVLSDNRAGAVKNYLTGKGIDASRLKSTGYGETKPVADNSTAAGRAKNRRTEMTVRNY